MNIIAGLGGIKWLGPGPGLNSARSIYKKGYIYPLLEQQETIEPSIRQQVSAALKIQAEAIQNFDAEKAITIVSSTFDDNAAVINNNPSSHPIDKPVQLHKDRTLRADAERKR